jgi:hypothetical protein
LDLYKTTVDKYYSKRYDYLVGVAGRVLRKLKRTDLAEVLVTDSYNYFMTGRDKLYDVVMEGGTEAVAVRWMTMQCIWGNTPFRNEWVKAQYNSELPLDLTCDEPSEYEEQHSKEWDALQEVVAGLDTVDKRLYQLAIIGPYNTSGKLAEFTGLSRTTTYFMIKLFKEKLRNDIRSRVN